MSSARRNGPIQIVGDRGGSNFRPAPAVAGDPDFSSVVLLLDFAGADGGTDITDLSNSAHVDTFEANAEIDTAIQYLGKNTLLQPANLDYIHFPDSDDWDFGTGDFTIELGWRPFAITNTVGIISNFSTGLGWGFQHEGTGGSSPNELNFIADGLTVAEKAWAPTAGVMYHMAASRSGTDLRLFIDGVQLGTTVTDSSDMTGATQNLLFGALQDGPVSQGAVGSVGAVRITKGVARYTANFTPPTVFYPTS